MFHGVVADRRTDQPGRIGTLFQNPFQNRSFRHTPAEPYLPSPAATVTSSRRRKIGALDPVKRHDHGSMAHQILIVYCMSGRYQVTASAMINRALQVTKPADGEGSEVGCGGCGWRAAPAAAAPGC